MTVINVEEMHDPARVLDAGGRVMVAKHLRDESQRLDHQAHDYDVASDGEAADRARTRADYYRLSAAELLGGQNGGNT